MKEITIEGVLDVVNKCENLDISKDQIEENLSALGMNSITFIQIVVGLEEAFCCEIPDYKLLITEMDTIKKMFDVLEELYKEEMI